MAKKIAPSGVGIRPRSEARSQVIHSGTHNSDFFLFQIPTLWISEPRKDSVPAAPPAISKAATTWLTRSIFPRPFTLAVDPALVANGEASEGFMIR